MKSIAIALALLAGAADGETRVGSRLDPAARQVNNADMSELNGALYRFMECAVARREVRVRAFIDARDVETMKQNYVALSDVPRCSVGGYLGNDVDYISYNTDISVTRGFVAEAFIKKDRKRAEALPALPLQKTYSADWYAVTGRPQPFNEMATCVAATNPAGILTLLKTGIGSKEEKAAVGTLTPTLGQCLATGYKLNANRLSLRTALAEALYHRTFDAPSGAVGGAN